MVRWTNEAILSLALLTAPERHALFGRLDLVTHFPAMYPVRRRGRFYGLRFFVLAKRWIVYYRSEEEDILLLAIVPALARPR